MYTWILDLYNIKLRSFSYHIQFSVIIAVPCVTYYAREWVYTKQCITLVCWFINDDVNDEKQLTTNANFIKTD